MNFFALRMASLLYYWYYLIFLLTATLVSQCTVKLLGINSHLDSASVLDLAGLDKVKFHPYGALIGCEQTICTIKHTLRLPHVSEHSPLLAQKKLQSK